VCGKFYVNEGSLRKHIACHPEYAGQLSAAAAGFGSTLRMWPCSVCPAVFTNESSESSLHRGGKSEMCTPRQLDGWMCREAR